MTHDLYRELLQRELDDDLSGDELAMLEAHVSTCADCRQEREEYQSLAFGFSKLSLVMPEKSFVPQLELEVRRAVQAHAKQRTRTFPVWWRSATAAAVIVLAVGLAGYWQFSGSNQEAPSGSVAMGTASKQSQADGGENTATKFDRAASSADTTQPDAPAQQPEQTAPVAAPAGGTAPAATQRLQLADATERSSAQLPPQTASSSVAGTTEAARENQEHAAASAEPSAPSSTEEDSDTLTDGVLHGAGGTSSAAPDHATGLTGGGVGMLGGVEEVQPHLGAVFQMNAYTQTLQQQVRAGSKSVLWATDPALVVDHERQELGFRADAQVRKATQANEVRVEQDGIEYQVSLEQPFEQGAQGVWRPTQVGRVIKQDAPDALERPVVEHFRATPHGDLLILAPFDASTRTMLVSADIEVEGKLQEQTYLCTLKLNATGDAWELDGSPLPQ